MVDEESKSGEEQAAAVPPETTETNQPESANQSNEKTVPLSALEAERSKRQQMEEENRLYREHLALMQANQRRQTDAPQQKAEAEVDDSDVMTYGEFKKHAERLTGQFQMTLEELKTAQKHPDYQEVVTTFLPELLKTNPELGESLRKTQDYELAYYLAKTSDGYKKAKGTTQRSSDAERIIKNAESSGSLSSLGASTPVSQARRYKDMSDADFRNLVSQNMGE